MERCRLESAAVPVRSLVRDPGFATASSALAVVLHHLFELALHVLAHLFAHLPNEAAHDLRILGIAHGLHLLGERIERLVLIANTGEARDQAVEVGTAASRAFELGRLRDDSYEFAKSARTAGAKIFIDWH